jgi:hypothetical protein
MSELNFTRNRFAEAFQEGMALFGVKNVMTRDKITRTLHQGKFGAVAEELAKYGQLIACCSWQEDEGRYAGHNKTIVFQHLGLEWVLESVDDEIMTMGYYPISKKELAIIPRV